MHHAGMQFRAHDAHLLQCSHVAEGRHPSELLVEPARDVVLRGEPRHAEGMAGANHRRFHVRDLLPE